MTNKQSHQLFAQQRAMRLLSIHTQRAAPSKRSAKNNGRGTGQVLRNSRIISLEYYHNENVPVVKSQ